MAKKNPAMEKFMQDTVRLYDKTDNELSPSGRKYIEEARKRDRAKVVQAVKDKK